MMSFKAFLEKKEEPENYIDGMERELGIDPNTLPDFIESGPIEIPDENILYNQAIWRVIKPIESGDKFIRIQFHKSKSPNLNQHCYRRKEDGSLVPYIGKIEGAIHLIPIDQFAEILGRGWQAAAGAPGGLPGGIGL